MKKFLIYIWAVLVATACDPVVDDKPIGGIVPENELKLTVRNVEEGGNEILLVEGKSWVWDDASGAAYGCGGYGYSVLPDWGGSTIGEETPAAGLLNGDDEMSFDLDGGANFTLRLADGTEKKGTFVFDMTKTKGSWSIGTLELKGATIPCAYDYYDGGDEIFSFDILKLTEDELVLAWAAPGALFQDPDWSTLATYWCFKKK